MWRFWSAKKIDGFKQQEVSGIKQEWSLNPTSLH